jgi:hypothetical protein
MVPDGPKGLPGRLDEVHLPSLDSLGFGLAWDDPQAQRSGQPHSCEQRTRDVSAKAEETLLFLRLVDDPSSVARVGRQAIEMEKLWQLQHRQ